MGASASREKFRESVSALIEVDVSADDADFWDELWKIPSSPEEVFELIPPQAARRLRDERFENLATLFTQATAQLCQIVETPYNIYFDQALNCVRVLTRILPFLLEKGDLGDADENVEQLCWGTNAAAPGDEKIGLMVGGNGPESGTLQSGGVAGRVDEEQEPLALLVVHAAMHMLFLPQFTCDFYEDKKDLVSSFFRRSDTKEDKELRAEAGLNAKTVEAGVSMVPRPTSIVWAPGTGVEAAQMGYDAATRKYDKNRIEVLRLMLAACCDPLFSPADEYNPVIGGGPGGMFFCHAARKHNEMKQQADKDDLSSWKELKVTCFEQASTPGGVWRNSCDDAEKEDTTRIYDELWTNGPSHAMEFYDYTFDEHFQGKRVPMYLPRDDVSNYLISRVTKDCPTFFEDHFEFNTRVENVRPVAQHDNSSNEGFEITIVDLKTQQKSVRHFDKCIWACGTNGIGKIPESLKSKFEEAFSPAEDPATVVDSLQTMQQMDVLHSPKNIKKRPPQDALLHSTETKKLKEMVPNRKVLLIGGGYSAEDLALQCIKWGAQHVDISARSSTSPVTWTTAWPDNRVQVHTSRSLKAISIQRENRDPFSSDKFSITLEPVEWTWPEGYRATEDDTLILNDIDVVVSCTGYKPNLSMLDEKLVPEGNTIPAWWMGADECMEFGMEEVEALETWKMTSTNAAHPFAGDVDPGKGRMLRLNYNHPGLHRGILLRNPAMMFLSENGSDLPLLSLDVHAWLLCSYLTERTRMPTETELKMANVQQLLDQLDQPFLRYCMDEGYCGKLDELSSDEFWPNPDGTTEDCAWWNCENDYNCYQLRLLAQVMNEGEYPGVSLGSYQELSEAGFTLHDFNMKSYYCRQNLSIEKENQEGGETFRDNSEYPKQVFSLYTGSRARPLSVPWLEVRSLSECITEKQCTGTSSQGDLGAKPIEKENPGGEIGCESFGVPEA